MWQRAEARERQREREVVLVLRPLSTGRGDYVSLLSCVLTFRMLLNFNRLSSGFTDYSYWGWIHYSRFTSQPVFTKITITPAHFKNGRISTPVAAHTCVHRIHLSECTGINLRNDAPFRPSKSFSNHSKCIFGQREWAGWHVELVLCLSSEPLTLRIKGERDCPLLPAAMPHTGCYDEKCIPFQRTVEKH